MQVAGDWVFWDWWGLTPETLRISRRTGLNVSEQDAVTLPWDDDCRYSFSADGTALVTYRRDGLFTVWSLSQGVDDVHPVLTRVQAGRIEASPDGENVTISTVFPTD
ncbi:MAG: hypothetical protein GY851_23645 [bacterium]|nr:hypothetical protein [bacterium]